MGLFGKGTSWSALHSMGGSQGESQHLLSQREKIITHTVIHYFNPIVLLKLVREQKKAKQWPKEERKTGS
uniref:S2 protein n=1 Tax=Equine infectious anemia virus TaxID=11665 RepID=A0A8A3BD69_9RETR|nr:S2 protein [Equine infectious anemia virus]